MIHIWMGYDSQFDDNVIPQLQSIANHTKEFHLHFLKLEELSNLLTRSRDPLQSTDSAFTRWLVPYLSSYEGWHLYMDADMMVRADLHELEQYCDPNKAVMVVKHPRYFISKTKFNNKIQTDYDKKNWSSLMLFNSEKCKALSLKYINECRGLDLHQFKWIEEDLIGELPKEWNHLVGLEPPNPDAKIVHWTLGGPWFEEYKDCEFNQEWAKSN